MTPLAKVKLDFGQNALEPHLKKQKALNDDGTIKTAPTDLVSQLNALFEKVQAAEKPEDVVAYSDQFFDLMGKQHRNTKVQFREDRKYCYLRYSQAVEKLWLEGHYQAALTSLEELKRLSPGEDHSKIVLLEATIISRMENSPYNLKICGLCYAIHMTKVISAEDDKTRHLVHEKLAKLFGSRAHLDCYADQETVSCATPDEEMSEVTPVEQAIINVLEIHYKQTDTENWNHTLKAAECGLNIIDGNPLLVSRIPLLQERDYYFQRTAAERIAQLRKFSMFPKAFGYVNTVSEKSHNQEDKASAYLTGAILHYAEDKPKSAGQTCSTCKAIQLLKRAPTDVSDKLLRKIHEQFATLYADRVQREHKPCPEDVTRTSSSLFIHASQPDSQADTFANS